MILADTDVLIDFLADEGAAAQVATNLARGSLCTTVVTRFELLVGARADDQRRATLDLLAAMPTLELTIEAVDHAAELRRALDQQGQRIGMADCLIAGTALSRALPLLTRNRRHFDRVQGLVLIDLE